MIEFKVGDEITGAAYYERYDGELVTGIVTNDDDSICGTAIYVVDPEGEDEDPRYIIADTAVAAKEPAKLSFVGPEPEPAEAPEVTTPFEVDQEDPRAILDSRMNHILLVNGDITLYDHDVELTALVVRLLNEHFASAS